MSEYKVTIGLEIHAELKTQTKMFCNSKNDPDEKEPNANVCPVCMGHPGTLPVINKEAVKHVLKVGLVLGGELADITFFDRKNYFYPDIPKGYQISQYKYPLVKGGELNGVKITRVHLEEDTATSKHPSTVSGQATGSSLVDFNRAGIPLMELVTEPVITSAKEAGDFARELRLLLRTLGVAEANMEKGEMRVEANISVSKDNKMGTKTEVKNLNSFKVAEKAIEYEIKRQSELLEKGEEVVQETRGWNDLKAETYSQRQKEGSADYRYFPDPDLPKLKISEISEFSEESLQKELPELPDQKRERYKKDYGIKEEDINFYLYNEPAGKFFEDVTKAEAEAKLASNYITSDVAGLGGDFENLNPSDFAELVKMAESGEVSSRGAKDILAIMYEKGGNPREIATEKNLFQKSDEGELGKIIKKIIEGNPSVVEDYKKGKENALQFLVGQGMKETKGSANPQILSELFKKHL